MKIAVDTTLVFETGEYSDYSFTGPFRVLREFDQAYVCERFRLEWTGDDWKEPDGQGFIAWMAKEGYIEDVPDAVSWYVGSYGRFEPEIPAEPA